ncbi:unnamed protein product [Phytophthora fragariaefolia]|uniref:Unnamed protein product n=1 Tax=Phytophthora fragariaefolia TaxID=1490495 RepID=A0A9W7CZM1_9STRA|nr:unnamed protein product [Phytophthora fragariaefolia]
MHAREPIYVLDVQENELVRVEFYAYQDKVDEHGDSIETGTVRPLESGPAMVLLADLIRAKIRPPVMILRWKDTGNDFQAVHYPQWDFEVYSQEIANLAGVPNENFTRHGGRAMDTIPYDALRTAKDATTALKRIRRLAKATKKYGVDAEPQHRFQTAASRASSTTEPAHESDEREEGGNNQEESASEDETPNEGADDGVHEGGEATSAATAPGGTAGAGDQHEETQERTGSESAHSHVGLHAHPGGQVLLLGIGVAILINPYGAVKDMQGWRQDAWYEHLIMATGTLAERKVLFINIYAPVHGPSRVKFYLTLLSLSLPDDVDVICGSDFNCVLDQNTDRLGGSGARELGARELRAFLDKTELSDAGEYRKPRGFGSQAWKQEEGRATAAGGSEPSRQSRRVANLGVKPLLSLEDVERDARKDNAEWRKTAKEATEVSAQEGVSSGSAVQDAHQVSKSGGQDTAPERSDVSMSTDSKLGRGDEDKSVLDASAQVSVGGADVDEPRWEVEYVETKKPQFGPADDVEVVEVGSDPDDDDDEVELMKVEPAVRKEAHLSTVEEVQGLEDTEVSSLKASGTASIRT